MTLYARFKRPAMPAPIFMIFCDLLFSGRCHIFLQRGLAHPGPHIMTPGAHAVRHCIFIQTVSRRPAGLRQIHVAFFQASVQKSLHFVGNRNACGQQLRKKRSLDMSFEKNALIVVELRFEKVVQWRRRRGWRSFSTSTRFVEGCHGSRRIHCRLFSTADL